MLLLDVENTIEQYCNKNIHLEIIRPLKAGKEAQVFTVKYRGNLAALKIYKKHDLRSFNNISTYIDNWYIPSRTMRQAVRKRTKLGRQYVQNTWVNREFKLLQKVYELGCWTPEPYANTSNSILMEYLGDRDSPAPLIKDTALTKEDARRSFLQIMESIAAIFEAEYVHADLSPFNILWWKGNPYIIDFPQAIEVRSSPHVKKYLTNDINNVKNFFGKFIDISSSEIEDRLYALCDYL